VRAALKNYEFLDTPKDRSKWDRRAGAVCVVNQLIYAI